VLLSPIPAFLSGANYSMRGFRQAVRLSPVRRLLNYLQSLLKTDRFNKEIKVFGLGDPFVGATPRSPPTPMRKPASWL
jgi:ATP-binding cassette subfamily B protein